MADYPYIMGLLRSLESKLINQNDIDRMVNAPDAEAAFRVFNDTEYADNLLGLKPQEFKIALDRDIKKTRNLYEQIVSNRKIIEFLFLRYDFHNLKLLFKEKYSGKDLSEEESEIGTIPASSLRNYILNNARVDLPNYLREIIDRAGREFEKRADPHFIDAYLDGKMFKLLKKITAKIDNQFISDFLKMQIDIANIKIFLRATRLGKEAKWLENEFIEGGCIKKEELLSVYGRETKEALNTFFIHFDRRFIGIITAYLEEGNLWQLERDFENYELRYLKDTKRMSYGPEIIVSYYFAKKNALRNTRLIMTGKLNGVSPAEIKERLRKLW